MMCPDNGAIDHVGASIPLDQFNQSFKHCFEHTGLDPASISAEDAIPLAVFIRQVSPLRTRTRHHPHHAFEIAPIVLSRAASASLLGGKKRADQRPFLVRQTDPFAQGYLQMKALNQKIDSAVNLCPRTLGARCRWAACPPACASGRSPASASA